MKHVPLRSCIVCRQQKDKSELLRIVRSSDGEISLDTTGRAAGRGAYVCNCDECVTGAVKKRVFNRVFKEQVDGSVYERLLEDYGRMKTDGQIG